jgi:AbrB family looped-hinge helix DNA binding protein
MQRLTVDAEGRIVIPPEITYKRGLRPGDELTLLETEHGLLVCQEGLALLEEWWNSLTDEEKLEASKEAVAYESLSQEERDAIWNQFPESIEEEAEGDEIDLSAIKRSTR